VEYDIYVWLGLDMGLGLGRTDNRILISPGRTDNSTYHNFRYRDKCRERENWGLCLEILALVSIVVLHFWSLTEAANLWLIGGGTSCSGF